MQKRSFLFFSLLTVVALSVYLFAQKPKNNLNRNIANFGNIEPVTIENTEDAESFTENENSMVPETVVKEETGQLLAPMQLLTTEFSNANRLNSEGNYCHKFIKANGSLGRLGQKIIDNFEQFKELENELLSDEAGTKAGMSYVCPQFSQLERDQRIQFWIWTLASLALYESTCGYDTENSQNTLTVGLYQLNKIASDRLPRALVQNKYCAQASSQDLEDDSNNLLCAMDFIRDSFSGRVQGFEPGLISKVQQFQKFKDRNSNLIRLIKKFKLCQ